MVRRGNLARKIEKPNEHCTLQAIYNDKQKKGVIMEEEFIYLDIEVSPDWWNEEE